MSLSNYNVQMLPRGAESSFDALAHPPRSAQGEAHIVARGENTSGLDFAHPPRSAPGSAHIIARALDDQLKGHVGLAARQIGIVGSADTASPVQKRSATGARRMKHKREASAYPSVVGDYFGGQYDGDALEEQAISGMTFSSASQASARASSTATASVKARRTTWSDGSVGTLYTRNSNGALAQVTDASNVFVIEGGEDTSHGDPLQAKIVTSSKSANTSESKFWLVDTTGNFCDNEALGEDENNCYITLGDGYNLLAYSLVPYDVSENNNTVPSAMWTIDQQTGLLTGHYEHHKVSFTQNENEVGNGDIDAYAYGETAEEGYVVVDLLLKME